MDEGHLKTKTRSEFEEFVELDVVLCIQGDLGLVEGGEHLLRGSLGVGVGDHEECGTCAVHPVDIVEERLPRVVDVPTGTSGHIAVHDAVELYLGGHHDVVNAGLVVEFIRCGDAVHTAFVAVGERVGTEGGEQGHLCAAVGSGVGFHNVHRREKTAFEGARLVL